MTVTFVFSLLFITMLVKLILCLYSSQLTPPLSFLFRRIALCSL